MATVSKNRQVYRRAVRRSAHSSTGKRKGKHLSTNCDAAHVFLSQEFMPLWNIRNGDIPDPCKLESDFFKSLSFLAKLYGFTPIDVKGYSFPENILVAHSHAERQIRRDNYNLSLLILQDDDGSVYLATRQHLNTGYCLYHVPVLPLLRLLQGEQTRRAALLLLSVFTYLYKCVKIPYYNDGMSYLYGIYEMIIEWIMMDEGDYDEADFRKVMHEITDARDVGDYINHKISDRRNLLRFKHRLSAFHPVTDLDDDCLFIAKAAYRLYESYPKRTLTDATQDGVLEQGEEYVYIEQYVSFVAETKGELYRQVTESVNAEFQEVYSMEEPTIVQVFDRKQRCKAKGLEFERDLFYLLDNLCSILNKY